MKEKILTPEQIAEKKRKAVEYTLKSRAKKREKTVKNFKDNLEELAKEYNEKLKEIAGKEVKEFEELRGLALQVVKEILTKDGASRDKLAAANVVLNRTDPEKKTLQVEVSIHPIDLTPFKRLSCNVHQNALPDSAIDCEFQELSPQSSPLSN